MATCTVDDCGRDTSKGGKGLCSMHRSRVRAGRPVGPVGYIQDPSRTLQDRLIERTQRTPNGCLEWTGPVLATGYGKIGDGSRVRTTHRVSYEVHVGPIPDGLTIDHLCSNKRCVEPSHLEPVTGAENTARAAERRIPPAACQNGHAMSGDNVVLLASGRRRCRTCRRSSQSEWRHRQRMAVAS